MKYRVIIAAGAALLLSLFSLSASAGSTGWYAGVEGGASFLSNSDNTISSGTPGTPGTGGTGGTGGTPASPGSYLLPIPGLGCLITLNGASTPGLLNIPLVGTVLPSSACSTPATPGTPGTGGTPGTPGTFSSLETSTQYDTGWLGGLTLGYLFDSGWRLEAEARYAQNDMDKTEVAGVELNSDGKLSSIALMANAWYNFNADGSWHPYIGGGIGAARLDLSTADFDDNQFQFAYQGGVGLAFDFTDRLTGDIGYRYFATTDPTFTSGNTRYESEYQQNIALLSLRYTFASRELQDTDGDGVPDYQDQCPGTPAGTPVDANGCPLDADGDGVADNMDECPNTPQGVQVDGKGCPLDSDGDGVPDYKDQCPNTPAGVKVDGTGCPLVVDSDGDGVPNNVDQCPNTPAGVAVMTNGCAVGQSAILEGVKFNFNRATLTPSAESILNDVVMTLKDSPGFNVKIAGYTDAIGSDAYNMSLSIQRAGTVKQYLVNHGIDASRLTAEGHGENNPIASNATEAGRAQNRRVELTPVTKG